MRRRDPPNVSLPRTFGTTQGPSGDPSMLQTMMVVATAGALVLAAPRSGAWADAPGSGAKGDDGVVSLFDGKSLRGWTDVKGEPPSTGWEVVDGAIHRRA